MIYYISCTRSDYDVRCSIKNENELRADGTVPWLRVKVLTDVQMGV
jgi:hypothetical protein